MLFLNIMLLYLYVSSEFYLNKIIGIYIVLAHFFHANYTLL